MHAGIPHRDTEQKFRGRVKLGGRYLGIPSAVVMGRRVL